MNDSIFKQDSPRRLCPSEVLDQNNLIILSLKAYLFEFKIIKGRNPMDMGDNFEFRDRKN